LKPASSQNAPGLSSRETVNDTCGAVLPGPHVQPQERDGSRQQHEHARETTTRRTSRSSTTPDTRPCAFPLVGGYTEELIEAEAEAIRQQQSQVRNP
jgi:hypothetical protein